VDAAALFGGVRVLDLCAGTGDLAYAVAATEMPAEVVATDFSPEMLSVAQRKSTRVTRGSKVTFLTVDAQELPFPDASFDVVTVAFGVRNLPDRLANFVEVFRVLAPGGRYVILEFSTPPNAIWRKMYYTYLKGVIPLLGSILTRGDRASFDYLNASIRLFPNQPTLALELKEAGFTEVRWQNLTGGIVAIHTAVR